MGSTMYPADILNRRLTKFVLWTPGKDLTPQPPHLILAILHDSSGDVSFEEIANVPLLRSDSVDLWELDPTTVSPPLAERVYHYWFEVVDDTPWGSSERMPVTDPLAFTVDYRLVKLQNQGNRRQPAAVTKFRDGKLWPCDIDGNEAGRPVPLESKTSPANNHLVIYEIPCSWAKQGNDERGVAVDIGTFVDVKALFDKGSQGSRFASIAAVQQEALLEQLGVNAVELLPAGDAKTKDAWGYATAHYFAPDYDLGTMTQLVDLVNTLHTRGVRLFADVVMAFGHDPYQYISFDQFHIESYKETNNPDSYQSHTEGQLRDGYGGASWRYVQTTQTYDPESGEQKAVHPSWSFHHTHLARWMTDFQLDGLRLDSLNNVGSWDFIKSYKEKAWSLYNSRSTSADAAKFLVIGEELSTPVEMVQNGVVNALWNESFQRRIRSVILGWTLGDDNFEWTVRKMANCTLDTSADHAHGLGFWDGAQAVNYITSHDVEGEWNVRLYDFLESPCGQAGWKVVDKERRAKLAHACLLTSVGIPMIFAGEEFADQMDRPIGEKQIDPVNYGRVKEDWRRRLFEYVARLVKFRTKCPALGDVDTDFFHVDASRGGRIMAWKRGGAGKEGVVVVANFSDEDTPGDEYYVPNWPRREQAGWWEVTQGRDVPTGWVGREPLMRWEAKVYTRWRE